jgi:hypothetical protein
LEHKNQDLLITDCTSAINSINTDIPPLVSNLLSKKLTPDVATINNI